MPLNPLKNTQRFVDTKPAENDPKNVQWSD